MITQIDISNFRSIKEQKVSLKKLNILYGPNGSGKSSVMYAPYVMRNFFVNPGQRMDRLFNFGFINLGGIENVISQKKSFLGIQIKIEIDLKELNLYPYYFPKIERLFSFNLNLRSYSEFAEISFRNGKIFKEIEFSMPYSVFSKQEFEINNQKQLWNGLTFDNISDNEDAYSI